MERSRTLVSFDICPFVQKARIVFDLKGLDVPTSYIDLAEKPRWFLDRVPTGKVPVLLDGDKAIFESNVIQEYADEVTTGPCCRPIRWRGQRKELGWSMSMT